MEAEGELAVNRVAEEGRAGVSEEEWGGSRRQTGPRGQKSTVFRSRGWWGILGSQT